LHHPKTNNSLKISTEFSVTGWNEITLDYMDSVTKLNNGQLTVIFSQTKALAKKEQKKDLGTKLKSSHSILYSESQNSNTVTAYGGKNF
jgi:hypothetical protein